MSDALELTPRVEALVKGARGSDGFGTPLNLGKKIAKARAPLGGFYTPGHLKNHPYSSKTRDSGAQREPGRYPGV